MPLLLSVLLSFTLFLPWLPVAPPTPDTVICMLSECVEAPVVNVPPVLWLPSVSR
jgi:hypothetical protein